MKVANVEIEAPVSLDTSIVPIMTAPHLKSKGKAQRVEAKRLRRGFTRPFLLGGWILWRGLYDGFILRGIQRVSLSPVERFSHPPPPPAQVHYAERRWLSGNRHAQHASLDDVDRERTDLRSGGNTSRDDDISNHIMKGRALASHHRPSGMASKFFRLRNT